MLLAQKSFVEGAGDLGGTVLTARAPAEVLIWTMNSALGE